MSTIAILGAGSIGTAFAVTFARGGCDVTIWDASADVLGHLPEALMARLNLLNEHGLLSETPERIAERVQLAGSLEHAVEGAYLVQECAPEHLEIKQDLFARVETVCAPHAILASSSSAIQPSKMAAQLASPERLIVAHPGNPPYLLNVIEIVGSPATTPNVINSASALYRSIGMHPLIVKREIEGFIFNRLQGALLREAYCLVRDGIADVETIDTTVREGLGMRWAVAGPFEIVDLNTQGGIRSHAEKMGPAYARMGAERGMDDPWTADLVDNVTSQRRKILPLDSWAERVQWRDEQLMRLKKFTSTPTSASLKEEN